MRLNALGTGIALAAVACIAVGANLATAGDSRDSKLVALSTLETGIGNPTTDVARGKDPGVGPHLGGLFCLDTVPFDNAPYGYLVQAWTGNDWQVWYWSGFHDGPDDPATTAGDTTYLRFAAPDHCITITGYGLIDPESEETTYDSYVRSAAYGCYTSGWDHPNPDTAW